MKNQTKTFTKKTELVFTTIEIESRPFTNYGITQTGFYGSFKYGDSKNNLDFKQLRGSSLKGLLNLISKFLDCEIDERHYIIK